VFTRLMKALVEEGFPESEMIRVVLNRLNTHVAGKSYEAFPQERARRIATRLEFRYTRKHDSWLGTCRNWRSAC
jgi:hypothetical protein